MQAGQSECDMALALNRYLYGSVFPLLIKHARFFRCVGGSVQSSPSLSSSASLQAERVVMLFEATLHTVYRLSKCKSLTRIQLQTISKFFIAFTRYCTSLSERLATIYCLLLNYYISIIDYTKLNCAESFRRA